MLKARSMGNICIKSNDGSHPGDRKTSRTEGSPIEGSSLHNEINNQTVARPRLKIVEYDEFREREKTVVEDILESKAYLRMAAINFKELKLQKIIGQGAFGEVIKGTYLGTPVVVKRMVRQKIDEDNIRMFAEEIQLMMNLRHPNIVQVIHILRTYPWKVIGILCHLTPLCTFLLVYWCQLEFLLQHVSQFEYGTDISHC